MKSRLILIMVVSNAIANAQDTWSGEVIFDVNPMHVRAGQWDYIPHTITYKTDGKDWCIQEEGTSFERIWFGEHEAKAYRILFHFLGHAVELDEACGSKETAVFNWGAIPCPWIADAHLGLMVEDGPVSYILEERSSRSVKRSEWRSKDFDKPKGYEPIDRAGLAALLQSLGQPQN